MTTSRGIAWTRRAFIAGQIILILGLCFYSLMTTTPLVAAHSEWAWSGWALGAMADAAFIMAITADSTLARHGITHLGGWVRAFRGFTGLSVVYLNIWSAVEARDPVGVAIHIVAPALVMLLAEVGPVYTAALAGAEKTALAEAQKAQYGEAARMAVPPVPPTIEAHAVTDYFAQERAGMEEYHQRSAEAARQMMETIDVTTQGGPWPETLTVPVPSEAEPETERAELGIPREVFDADATVSAIRHVPASRAAWGEGYVDAPSAPAAQEYRVAPETADTTAYGSAVTAEGGAALVDSVEDVADALGMSLEEPQERMSNAEANKIIEEGWRYGEPATVVAKATGRHVQTVRRKYKEHDDAA